MGVLAAWKHGTWIDRAVMVIAVLGFSVPVFVIGYLLAYVFALTAGLAAGAGLHLDQRGVWPFLRNLILPIGGARADLHGADRPHHPRDDAGRAEQDYVRTAKAKGVGQRGMLFVHALKNAAVPIVTVDRHRLRAR